MEYARMEYGQFTEDLITSSLDPQVERIYRIAQDRSQSAWNSWSNTGANPIQHLIQASSTQHAKYRYRQVHALLFVCNQYI
eukprot:1161294-Pelagomonas_calceolata.AAC.1